MNDSYAFQIGEFKKFDYSFFEGLAFGGDELTYTFADNQDTKPIQVEVSARFLKKAEGIVVTIDFCSDQGKWVHTSDAAITHLVTKDNEWKESSYDGSEFEE